MFQKAKWIWINNENNNDEYGHFQTSFNYSQGKVSLNISCDGDYNVYLNNQLVAFGQYPDYPHYKVYQEVDLTEFSTKFQENVVEIVVWHYGIDYSSTYYPDTPGLIFEIYNDEKIMAYSHQSTLSKLHDHFISYQNKKITTQLGLSFFYDARENSHHFTSSLEIEKTTKFYKRPIKELLLKDRIDSKLISIKKDSIIFDLGSQEVGFLDLAFNSTEEQHMIVTFGEDLVDENVQRYIDDRDFSITYYAKEGYNKFFNAFLKLGCRYLQVYFKHPILVDYIGLKPVYYPIKKKHNQELSGIRKEIYDVSIKTLQNCMHEHYEDCPWREQALYTLDSRNQMLCGYYAFSDFLYPRSNLLLISKGQRASGLLDLCFPSKIVISIPFFSLVYPIQVYEYILHSQDYSILDEVYPVCERIIKAFENRIDEKALITRFETPYWNFYEWSEGSDSFNELIGVQGEMSNSEIYDLILNCYFLYSVKYFKILSQWMKKEYQFNEQKMIEAIHKIFYNEKEGLYRLNNQSNQYSVLGNSMAILANVPSVSQTKLIIDKMMYDKRLVPVTLSMKCYFYDALLQTADAYREYILDDIDKTYSFMLKQGATTFWETLKGKDDFDGAGSLCHGWSAMPVYYYLTLLKEEI